jgi:hypothetical protein
MSTTWKIPLACQQHEPFICHVNNMTHSSGMSTSCGWHAREMVHVVDMSEKWFMLLTCQRNGSCSWHVRGMVHVVDMPEEWFILLTCQRNGSCCWHDRGMVHVVDMPDEWFMLLHEPFLWHVNNMNHSSGMSTTWTIPLTCQQHEPFLWHVNNMNHSSGCQRNGSCCWHARGMVHVVDMPEEWFMLLTCQRNGSCCWHVSHRRFNIDFKEIVYRRHVSNRGHRVFGWMSSEFFLMSIRNQ